VGSKLWGCLAKLLGESAGLLTRPRDFARVLLGGFEELLAQELFRLFCGNTFFPPTASFFLRSSAAGETPLLTEGLPLLSKDLFLGKSFLSELLLLDSLLLFEFLYLPGPFRILLSKEVEVARIYSPKTSITPKYFLGAVRMRLKKPLQFLPRKPRILFLCDKLRGACERYEAHGRISQ
jgi:hypothetical protein